MILFRIAAAALAAAALHAAQAADACLEPAAPKQIALRIMADPGLKGSSAAADTIAQVMTNDLRVAERTTTVDVPLAMLGSPDILPDFDALKQAGAHLAIAIKVTSEPKSDIVAQLRIFDVQTRTQLVGERVRAYTQRTRSLAHSFADLVLSKLGTGPMFDTRIAAIVENKGAERLVVLDSDGENFMPLTTAGAYASPAFMSFDALVCAKETDAAAQLMLMSFVTGRREHATAASVVGDTGIAMAKDRPRIAFATKTGDADADIRVDDLLIAKQLFTLKLPGRQGEPTFSHDSRNLAFLSESGTARQITITDIDGKNARTIAGADRYKHIAWSPQKAEMAFVRETPTGDELGLMNIADASTCTLLTAPKIDRPSWSPNGSHLLIGAPDGDGIEILNLATKKRTKIATGRGTVRDTAWSGVWP